MMLQSITKTIPMTKDVYCSQGEVAKKQMTKDVYCSQGEVATNILLASISTALHLGNGPVTGQVGFFGIITSQQSFHCFSVILFVHNGQVASWEYFFSCLPLGLECLLKKVFCLHSLFFISTGWPDWEDWQESHSFCKSSSTSNGVGGGELNKS